MKSLLPILFLLLTYVCSASDPVPPLDYKALLDTLEVSLLDGNKRALRDVATLLDIEDSRIQNKARRLLEKYTLFSPQEFVIKKPQPKQEFLDFYYEIEQKLEFSNLLQAYHISDPAQNKIEYKIRSLDEEENIDASILLNQYIKAVEAAIASVSDKDLIKAIQDIQYLDREEGYNYLIELWESGTLQETNFESNLKIYEALATTFQEFMEMESLAVLASMTEQTDLSLNVLQKCLANLTNIYVDASSKEALIEKYAHFADSLGSLEDMKIYGYERLYTSRPSFFIESVDYYGKMLSVSGDNYWIEHNAIKDLSQSQHSRAMLYLSGYLYNLRNRKGKYARNLGKKIVQLIHKMTQLSIEVKNKKDILSSEGYIRKDRVARMNYMIYWAAHYGDYEWDENRSYFINKHEATETTQNYEKLFRRLNSKNDSVAIYSFVQLTEGEPTEIVALSEKYRQMFRNYNKSLPSFQYYYLEQLSQLTNYCRKNKINYTLSKDIETKLERILHSDSPQEKTLIENELIKDLTLEDITGVEYWACIHERDKDLEFSIGRILDHFYSKHLASIQADKKQLRLYLKKTDVFSNFGAIGACNHYLNKFDLSNKTFQSTLKSIVLTEADEGIVNQLSVLIEEEEEEEALNEVSQLEAFLQSPSDFNRKDVKIMPSPKKEEYQSIVDAIQNTDDINAIKRIIFYIRIHHDIEMVPYLFQLVDDKRVIVQKKSLKLTVADNLTPILEKIYNFSFPAVSGRKKFDIIPWAEMWEDNNKSFRDWHKAFFSFKVDAITKSEKVHIDDINQITTSSYYEERFREKCLNALAKISSSRDLRKLQISPKLKASKDLKYFKDIAFTYKSLDDIHKIFKIDRPDLMLAFIEEKSKDFDAEDRGSLYNNLLRASWFASYIESKDFPKEKVKEIQYILNKYLDESEYLSEYEEQNTELNIAQLSYLDKSIEERLLMSFQMGTNEASLIKIQSSILAKVKYKDLPIIIDNISSISPKLLAEDKFFIVNDFGLPIFDLTSSKEQKIFLKRHKTLTEAQLYQIYLKEFGVDFLTNGKLDFNKIYQILAFDVTTPFVSSSGGKRDYYTYGIIKLLELHFNTRLDFHEKLNESQTFYHFSAQKRADAWMAYLQANDWLDTDQILAPSFNTSREE